MHHVHDVSRPRIACAHGYSRLNVEKASVLRAWVKLSELEHLLTDTPMSQSTAEKVNSTFTMRVAEPMLDKLYRAESLMGTRHVLSEDQVNVIRYNLFANAPTTEYYTIKSDAGEPPALAAFFAYDEALRNQVGAKQPTQGVSKVLHYWVYDTKPERLIKAIDELPTDRMVKALQEAVKAGTSGSTDTKEEESEGAGVVESKEDDTEKKESTGTGAAGAPLPFEARVRRHNASVRTLSGGGGRVAVPTPPLAPNVYTLPAAQAQANSFRGVF